MHKVEDPPKAKTERKKPGEGAATEARALGKMIDALAKDCPMVKDDMLKFKQRIERILQALQLKDDTQKQEHEDCRAKLFARYGSRIYRDLRDNGSDEDKAFFRRIWKLNF